MLNNYKYHMKKIGIMIAVVLFASTSLHLSSVSVKAVMPAFAAISAQKYVYAGLLWGLCSIIVRVLVDKVECVLNVQKYNYQSQTYEPLSKTKKVLFSSTIGLLREYVSMSIDYWILRHILSINPTTAQSFSYAFGLTRIVQSIMISYYDSCDQNNFDFYDPNLHIDDRNLRTMQKNPFNIYSLSRLFGQLLLLPLYLGYVHLSTV